MNKEGKAPKEIQNGQEKSPMTMNDIINGHKSIIPSSSILKGSKNYSSKRETGKTRYGSKRHGFGSNRFKPFKTLEIEAPKAKSAEKKLLWLRSQLIGGGDLTEFDSPFGKRKVTYADHTASGRCLSYIEQFIINTVLPFYGNTHTCDSYVGQRTTTMVHEASGYIKRCLGGGQEDAVIYCGSGATSAIKRLQEVMGIAVPSIYRDKVIKCLEDRERWVVFVGPYEHHSNILSWRQSLAQVVEIGLDDNGCIDIEALKLQLETYKYSKRPILGSFSACSNVTGIISDTRKIATLLHKYGGFACFDFAASGPYVKIDMRSEENDGYDAIFISPHKFLGGPGSPGILLMSKALYRLGSSPPSTCGGGTVSYVNGFNEKDTLYLEDIEERENGGTPQIIQTIRAALAFWVKEYIGHEVIERQENIYMQKCLQRLLPNQNIHILGSTNAPRQAILSFLIYPTANTYPNARKTGSNQINAINEYENKDLRKWGDTESKRNKPLHGTFVATLLNDLFGIQARGGCACAGPYGHSLLAISETQSLAVRYAIQKGYNGVKPGWTRVSFPYYMSNEEFEFILAALEFTATNGHRFLTLYHFDLRSGVWTFKKNELQELLGREKKSGIVGKLRLVMANENLKKNMKIDCTQKGICRKYASYLERARHIAYLLAKHPSPQRLQERIDLDLYFIV